MIVRDDLQYVSHRILVPQLAIWGCFLPWVMSFGFFFSSSRRHTSSLCDWSSDVCSSDLVRVEGASALTGPLDVTASTCPLTLAATSGADAPSTRTLPLTVVAPSRTPRGSRTVKSTTTSFPCADPCRKTVPSPPPPPPPPPRPHRPPPPS